MKKRPLKPDKTDTRWFRLMKINIIFLKKLAQDNRRTMASQLDMILDKLRLDAGE